MKRILFKIGPVEVEMKVNEFISFLAIAASVAAFIFAISSFDKSKLRVDGTNQTTQAIDSQIQNIVIKLKEVERTTTELPPSVDDIKVKIETLNSKNKELDEQQQKILLYIAGRQVEEKDEETFLESIDSRVNDNINKRISDFDDKIRKIENVIVPDTYKALQIPFIRKDINTLETNIKEIVKDISTINDNFKSLTSYKEKVESLQKQINLGFNIMLTLMGGLIISIASLVIGNVINKKQSQPSQNEIKTT